MNFIKSRKYAPHNLGRVCVIGLGKTGLAVAQYLIKENKRVENLHVYAGDKTKFSMRSGDKLIKCGVSISFDDATLDSLYDLCIVSPGISPNNSIFKSALKNCKEVISEVEFA
jgi:UDP-N-acetylmuramoylalanine--D-glutamate ligase